MIGTHVGSSPCRWKHGMQPYGQVTCYLEKISRNKFGMKIRATVFTFSIARGPHRHKQCCCARNRKQIDMSTNRN